MRGVALLLTATLAERLSLEELVNESVWLPTVSEALCCRAACSSDLMRLTIVFFSGRPDVAAVGVGPRAEGPERNEQRLAEFG